VPGHENVQGNEQADQAVKEAAVTPTIFLLNIRMRFAQKRAIQMMTKIK